MQPASVPKTLAHNHPYRIRTSFEDGHFHIVEGETSIDNGGLDQHVHYFQGRTTLADGHTHYFVGITGPAHPHYRRTCSLD